MVIEAFPDAWLEDPDVNDETRPMLEPVQRARHLGRADPLGGGRARRCRGRPRMVNIKPSRFGPLSNLFEMYDWCEREGVRAYGGGQTELGRGPRPHPVPRLAIPPGHPERHGALRLQQPRAARRASRRARSSRASLPPASAGSSDRGDPAPSGRGPARDGAPDQRVSRRGARSLDLALYDIRLPDEPGDIVAAALRDCRTSAA